MDEFESEPVSRQETASGQTKSFALQLDEKLAIKETEIIGKSGTNSPTILDPERFEAITLEGVRAAAQTIRQV